MKLALLRRLYMAPLVEDGGGGGTGGGVAQAPTAPAPDVAAPAVAPAVAPVVADPVAAPTAPAAPATMLEAINRHFETQPRDEQGRWTPKLDATGAVIPGQVQPPNTTLVAPVAPVVAEPADPLAMPEGLGPKAQERFQRLANTVKETNGKLEQTNAELDQARRQTEYIRETFQTSGIRQEQFEQAVSLIAMINKGDLAGAQRFLTTQLQQISLMTGSAPQVDPLSNFPDLRQAVEGMQITEQHAIELARARFQGQQQQATQQRTEQTQQTQQQEQAAFDAGLNAVDAFCKQQAGVDMDWPAVEAQLQPVIKDLLQGVPPNLWVGKVKAQINLIKATAQRFKPAPTIGSNALRPTGQASPQQAPKSAYEAMWGTPARA